MFEKLGQFVGFGESGFVDVWRGLSSFEVRHHNNQRSHHSFLQSSSSSVQFYNLMWAWRSKLQILLYMMSE